MFTLRCVTATASRQARPVLSSPPAQASAAALSSRSADASASRLLLDTAEAQLGQAEQGLREAGRLGRRGAQAQQLARLAQTLAPQAKQLMHMARTLFVDPQDPLRGQVRQRVAAAALVQTLVTAGAAFLRAHTAAQGSEEVPALEADWRRRLCDEAQALLHRLSASPDPRDRAQAGLLLASAPGAALPALSPESLPAAIHHQAAQWRQRQGPEGLSITHWLALRLFAHPDSGAAAALQAQEHLVQLDRDLAEACAPFLGPLARQQAVAAASAARMPGLGVADPEAHYRLALPREALPHLDGVLREGGEWLVGRPLSTRSQAREAEPAWSAPAGGDPVPDSLLCLQSPSALAGPVRGLALALFHPPQDPARDRVLLMPGQVFRVSEEGEGLLAVGDGWPLRVRRYRLDKVGEETRYPVPGTLSPEALPADEPWPLAGAL